MTMKLRHMLLLATYVGCLSVIFWLMGFVLQLCYPKKVEDQEEREEAEAKGRYETLGGEPNGV